MNVQSRNATTKKVVGLVAVAAVLTSGACHLTTGCDADLTSRVSPVDTTILLGQSFRPKIALSTCGDSKTVTDVFRYSVDDAAIVRVDSSTGTLTGRALGHTTVSVTGAVYGNVARIGVTVQ